VDKRKTFFKTLDKIGTVETFTGWSVDDRDWAERAEVAALAAVRLRQKEISEEALAELVSRIGPHPRQLDNEVEKLCLFAGDRKKLEVADVAAICTRNKTARAFALGDALGDRDLPRLLRRLDEELWEIKSSSQKSEIGLLYGLISKVRAMLLLKEMLREGWIKPEMDYNRFKAQLERVPADQLPADSTKRWYCSKPWCKLSRRRRSRLENKKFILRNVNITGKIISIGGQGFCLPENRGPRQFFVQPRLQDAAHRA
jgi:DNA polymerase-3 subunit delta